MKLVECGKCHRVCDEEKFGQKQDPDDPRCSSACCTKCGSDAYYCIDAEGKRSSMADQADVPTIPHEFDSLKDYKAYLADDPVHEKADGWYFRHDGDDLGPYDSEEFCRERYAGLCAMVTAEASNLVGSIILGAALEQRGAKLIEYSEHDGELHITLALPQPVENITLDFNIFEEDK